MRMRTIALLAAFGLCSGLNLKAQVQTGSKVTPVGKVLTLLKSMLTRAEAEKSDEVLAFTAYKQWCEDITGQKSRAVTESSAVIDRLSADIAKFKSDAERLSREITGHDADVNSWTTDLQEATQIRSNESRDFHATHKDYSESVDAIERALVELKKQNFDRSQATALLQAVAAKRVVPFAARRTIQSYVSQTPSGLSYAAPEAHAYEFQSAGVIDMLEKLLSKFEDERNTLEKEEANSQHSFELLVQDLKNQIASTTADRNRKQEEKSQKEQAAASAASDVHEAETAKAADSTYLAELTNQCHTKASEFASRQTLRAGEVAALTQAVELISTAVMPNAEKHLPSLVQAATSLIQISASSKRGAQQGKVAMYLTEQAKKLKSTVLAQLAARVSEDPFGQVKKMIQDLVVRLMAEANQEAEHKGWCDTEMKANDLTRKAKTSLVSSLTAEVDELSAASSKLGQEVVDLQTELAELNAAVAKATENRETEHEVNTATIADAKESQEALAKALVVLKEFYAKAGVATAFAQQTPAADAPITWDKAYTGQQSDNKSVVDFIEVIQSDFARLEAQTTADEEMAAKEFSKFTQESALNKLKMTKDVEFKTDKKQTINGEKDQKTEDRRSAQAELDAALAYLEKLKPACIESGSSYEDRVDHRKEEIESLQEALNILSQSNVNVNFMQRTVRRH